MAAPDDVLSNLVTTTSLGTVYVCISYQIYHCVYLQVKGIMITRWLQWNRIKNSGCLKSMPQQI